MASMLALLNPYRVHIYFAIFRPIIVVKTRVFMLGVETHSNAQHITIAQTFFVAAL